VWRGTFLRVAQPFRLQSNDLRGPDLRVSS
jgi:hypothetical protein